MQRVKEKRERSLGVKLFLKAERCNSPKCVMVRKPHRPGMHGKKRKTTSEFGTQLKEKQKIQFTYGLNDTQMKKLFENPKQKIVNILETRLDRALFLGGIAPSTRISRQMINHGHIMVNGRRVTIPSYHMTKGSTLSIRKESGDSKLFEGVSERLKGFTAPAWMKISPEERTITCVGEPKLEDMTFPFNIDIVGEFYAR